MNTSKSLRDKHSRLQRVRLIEAGIDPMVHDLTAISDHLEWLQGIGMSHRVIGAAVDVSGTVVRDVLHGKRRMVRYQTAQKLLAVRPTPPFNVSEFSMVPKIGTVRRVQALARMGWSHGMITAVSGVSERQLTALNTIGVSCTYRHWRAVADAYDASSMTLRDCMYARLRAERQGWLPPLDWDVTDIDDPRCYPEGRNVGKAHALQLLRAGMTSEVAARCAGLPVHVVKGYATRYKCT